MSNQSSDIFLVMFVGQLEYVHLPDAHDIFIKFKFVHGHDFVVTTGIQDGITQTASRIGWDALAPLHLNFPLDITLKSTNPFGWPKLMLCAYGRDFLGREVLRGYGSIHMPAAAGRHALRIPLFKPQPSTTLGAVANLLSGRTPEFIDPSIVTRSSGREVVRTSSNGFVQVDISVVTKGVTQLGYACSALESRPISIASYNLPFALSNAAAVVSTSSRRSGPQRSVRLLSNDETSGSDRNSGKVLPALDDASPTHATIAPRVAADAPLPPRRYSGTIAEEAEAHEAENDEDDDSDDEDESDEDDEASSAVSTPNRTNNMETSSVPPQPTPRRRSSAISTIEAETPATGQVNENFRSSPINQTASNLTSRPSTSREQHLIGRDNSSSGSRSSGGIRHQPQQHQHTVQIEHDYKRADG